MQTQQEEICYVCLQNVDASEKFCPCNCSSLVHRQCLTEWIAAGHAKCAVCNLVYDADRANSCCFLCNRACAEQFAPCKCRFVIAHRKCLARAYAKGMRACRFCDDRYHVSRERKIVFPWMRCLYFWVIAITVVLNAFLIAPFDILAATPASSYIPNQQFTYNSDGIGFFPRHFFLFPDSDDEGLYMFGFLSYVILLPNLFAIGCYVCIGLHGERKRSERGEDEESEKENESICCQNCCRSMAKIVFFLSVMVPIILLLHLFGNIHYRFYCAIGVIPPVNCFWLFNWASFLASLSGILHVCLPLACLCVILSLLWRFFRPVVVERVVVNERPRNSTRA